MCNPSRNTIKRVKRVHADRWEEIREESKRTVLSIYKQLLSEMRVKTPVVVEKPVEPKQEPVKKPTTCECATEGCKTIVKKRNGRFCSKCKHRKVKKNDPVKYIYNMQKSNANRRGKDFGISLPDWREFWAQNPEALEIKLKDLMAGKKPSKHTISVDCIKSKLGYIKGNLQVMTVSLNASKGATGEWEIAAFKIPFQTTAEKFADVPF